MRVWYVASNLLNARYNLAGAGSQGAGLCMGGEDSDYCNDTEEYDGSSWSSGGDLTVARKCLAGAGSQGAGLCMGGEDSDYCNDTEEYDGSSWSSGGSLITARQLLAGAGTQSAGLCMGGDVGSVSAVTEEYDGSSWSSSENLSIARCDLASAGTQGAGLAIAGWSLGYAVDTTEEYNGYSWSSGGNLTTARFGHAGAGTQGAAICMGGHANHPTGEYDGTSWSYGGTLNTPRYNLAGAGTQTDGLCMGGYTGGSASVVTEEYAEEPVLKYGTDNNQSFISNIVSKVETYGDSDSGTSNENVELIGIFGNDSGLIGIENNVINKIYTDNGIGNDVFLSLYVGDLIKFDSGIGIEYTIIDKVDSDNNLIFVDNSLISIDVFDNNITFVDFLICNCIVEDMGSCENDDIVCSFDRDVIFDSSHLSTDIGTSAQGRFVPGQTRFIDTFYPYIFKYRIVPNDNYFYLAKEPNCILNAIGSDVVINDLKIISITIVDLSIIEVEIEPGRAIADNTLINFIENIILNIDCSSLTDTHTDSSHLGIFINYNHLHTSASIPASIDIFHISSDGNASDLTGRFNLIRHRVLIGIVDFTKDEDGNIISATESSLTTLLVNGVQMSLRGLLDSSISDLFEYLSNAKLTKYRDYLLRRDYLFME